MQSNKKIMNKRNESLRKSDLFIDSLRRQALVWFHFLTACFFQIRFPQPMLYLNTTDNQLTMRPHPMMSSIERI